jgi:hypothetical protein
MTRNSDRKTAIRAHAADKNLTYQQAARALAAEPADNRPRLMLPLHDPYTGPGICLLCTGAGVLKDWTVDFAGAIAVMVCHIFCPACSGCGRTKHTGCTIDQHAEPEAVGLDPDEGWDDDEDDLDLDTCYSCRGRRWWVMRAFSKTAVYHCRVPCGCSTDLLVPAPAGTR